MGAIMPKLSRTLVLAAALAALAAGAHAQTFTLVPAQPAQQSKVADATALNAAVSSRFSEAGALKGVGVARTSVDHRFEGKDASGAFGFLCGRPDSLDERAAAGAYGSDPHGRFLGARLSLAFR
jgi:hypothetical protein